MAGYLKGQMDRGDLAGKFVALVVFDDQEKAEAFVMPLDPEVEVTVHEVRSSHYDIDFDIHKILIYPAEKVNGD